MPFNGTGTFTLVSGNPVVTGTNISSTVQNNTMSDFANGFTNCITRDGQSAPTSNLPMGNQRHTGAANASGTGEYLVYGQALFGSSLTTTGNATVGGDGQINGALNIGGAFTAPGVVSNTYTPTLTNVSNVASSSLVGAMYIRIGSFVLVSGQFSMTATTTGTTNTLLGISLPVSSALAAAANLSGGVTGPDGGSAGHSDSTYILADTTNDRAQVSWPGVRTATQGFTFWFMYQVI